MDDELCSDGTVLEIVVAVMREDVAERGMVVFQPDDALVEDWVGEDGSLKRRGFDDGVLEEGLTLEVELVAQQHVDGFVDQGQQVHRKVLGVRMVLQKRALLAHDQVQHPEQVVVVQQVNSCAIHVLHEFYEEVKVRGYLGDVGVEEGVLHGEEDCAEDLEDEGVVL